VFQAVAVVISLVCAPATLVRTVDGDTYEIKAVVVQGDFLFNTSVSAEARVTIRLRGIDAPERYTAAGILATAAADQILRSGPVTVCPTGRKTFDRWEADVYVGTQSVAEWLLAAGHGTP
jgi:endonuclease YncB( thermonuclease family)